MKAAIWNHDKGGRVIRIVEAETREELEKQVHAQVNEAKLTGSTRATARLCTERQEVGDTWVK